MNVKRIFALGFAFAFQLLLWGCTTCESPQDTPAITAITTSATSTKVYWRWPYGHACALRDRAVDAYRQVEIDGNDLIQSTEGSSITGYYDEDKQLQIMEIIIYREVGRSILRFYPMKDAVAIRGETIWYTVPFCELTEEDQYFDGTERMSIEDGQLYYYIDEREPMYPSDNTWYAGIYAKALEALDAAR